MNVREKLMELVNDVLMYLPWGEIQKDTAERIVDRMMDHGVTMQEWISVDDRLPEKDGQYLIFTTKYFTPDHIDEIDHIDGTEISVYSKRFGFLSKNGLHAKYWCEMPQPPKGE